MKTYKINIVSIKIIDNFPKAISLEEENIKVLVIMKNSIHALTKFYKTDCQFNARRTA